MNIIGNKKIFYAGLAYFISIVLFIVMRMIWASGIFSELDSNINQLLFTVVLQIGVLMILPICLYKLFTKQTFRDIKRITFCKKVSLPIVLYSIIIGILAYIIIVFTSTIWSALLSVFGYSPSSTTTTSVSVMPVWASFLLAVLSTAILPAIGEEFIHRGLIMGNLKNNGVKRAILLSALFFGLAHLNIAQTGYAFVIGLILGSVVFVTRSIIPAIIIHGTSNFCSVYFSYASANGWVGGDLFSSLNGIITSNYFVGFLLCMLIIVIVLTLLAFCMVKLFAYTKKQKFDQFKENLYQSLKGTEHENEINFNDQATMVALFNSAAMTDLREKVETGDVDVDFIEKEFQKKSITNILYSEFDEYQPPRPINYIFFYCTIFLGCIVTLMTFIWGIM